MASISTDVRLEELLAQKTIVRDNGCAIITIPGFASLSGADRRALGEKVVAELDAEQDAELDAEQKPPPDLKYVNAALQRSFLPRAAEPSRNFSRESSFTSRASSFITPPPDPEVYLQISRAAEAKSRQALLDEGVTPCYPPELDLPLENLPEKYEMISYWQLSNSKHQEVLGSQLRDWDAFCSYQRRVRRYWVTHDIFNEFIIQVRDRRQRHGLVGDVSLLTDIKPQSRLQNWVEFQNYHLHHYEKEKEELKQTEEEWSGLSKEELDEQNARLKDAGVFGMSILQSNLKFLQRKVEAHGKMLRWIEQQRQEMVDEHAPSVGSPPIPIVPSRRNRNHQSRSPLDPVRSAVSKQPAPKRKAVKRGEFPVAAKPTIRSSATVASSGVRRSARIANQSSRCGDEYRSLRLPPSKATKTMKNPPRATETIKNPPTKRSAQRQPKRPNAIQPSPSRVQKSRLGREIKRPPRLRFERTGHHPDCRYS